jgi:hypothetical protein
MEIHSRFQSISRKGVLSIDRKLCISSGNNDAERGNFLLRLFEVLGLGGKIQI